MKKLFLVCGMLAVTGCSLVSKVPQATDEEKVAALALQRYQAMMAGDYRKAYKLMTPGYRVINSLQDFKAANVGVTYWEALKIGKAVCSEDACKVGVRFEYRPSNAGYPASGGAIRDVWRRVDGQWYYLKPE